jgi:hypothetical protein
MGRVGCHAGTAARRFEQFVSRVSSLGDRRSDLDGRRFHRRCDFGLGYLKPLKSQFQLRNLAGNLLGTGPELLSLEPRNLQPQGLHQQVPILKIGGAQTALQLKDQRLQRLGVIWQGSGFDLHGFSSRKAAQKSMKTRGKDAFPTSV